jgi:hypothetical protein
MGNVNLHLLAHGSLGLVQAKLLANLEEALFYFLLNSRLKLLLHIIQFKILTLKILERLI